jgi:hypothetical protein
MSLYPSPPSPYNSSHIFKDLFREVTSRLIFPSNAIDPDASDIIHNKHLKSLQIFKSRQLHQKIRIIKTAIHI